MFRVVLTVNGKYRKTIGKYNKRDNAFKKYNSLIIKSNNILFPKKFINSFNKVEKVTYKLYIVSEPSDKVRQRTIKDKYGRLILEPYLGEWVVLNSSIYNIEEDFWVFKYDKVKDRLTIKEILLIINYDKTNKEFIVIDNKLLIHNTDFFEMIICKNINDAQRLHHTIHKLLNNISNHIFMGTCADKYKPKYYDLIHKKTKWSYKKIKRPTT
jgi:hypothetical protein